MANVISSASTVWEGNVARGSGTVTGDTGVFSGVPFDLPTRIGETTGGKTTPEELVAAAHVACLTMSIGTILARAKTPAERIEATSRVTLVMGGEQSQIGGVAVEVRGTVPGIDEAGFQAAVKQAEQTCLISRVLMNGGVPIEATGTLA